MSGSGRRAAAGSAVTLAALLCLGVSCTTVRVGTDHDPSADFSGLRTWAFADARQTAGDPRLDSSLVRARILQALESELAAKGYGRAVGIEPDFLVDIHVALSRGLDVEQFHRGASGRAWRSETLAHEVERGTLVIDFLHPRTRELLWRGIAQAQVDRRSSSAERTQRIREAVKLLLRDFPPQP